MVSYMHYQLSASYALPEIIAMIAHRLLIATFIHVITLCMQLNIKTIGTWTLAKAHAVCSWYLSKDDYSQQNIFCWCVSCNWYENVWCGHKWAKHILEEMCLITHNLLIYDKILILN